MYKPKFRLDDYLVYMLRKIPLSQMRVEPNASITHISGPLYFDYDQLSPDLANRLREQVRLALNGQIAIAGTTLALEEQFKNQQYEIRTAEGFKKNLAWIADVSVDPDLSPKEAFEEAVKKQLSTLPDRLVLRIMNAGILESWMSPLSRKN